MFIKVKKLHDDAVIPAYQTDGAGAFDIHCIETGILPRGTNLALRTGLAFEIPPGFAMMIYSRSGHGFKEDIKLSNCTGIIDSDYRGELMIKLWRDDPSTYFNKAGEMIFPSGSAEPVKINVGDRIAQGIILPVPRIQFIETQDLSETARGTGGFGSTGA